MVIVLLHHLSASRVVLENLLVAHASQELVRCARVDAYNMWCLPGRELVQTFASLGIPKLHITIVTG